MSEQLIDPVQFGRLIAGVENLTKEVVNFRSDLKDVEAKLQGLANTKWFIVGVAVASGGTGALVSQLMSRIGA